MSRKRTAGALLITLILNAPAQDTSTDELWRMLQDSSANENTPSPYIPRELPTFRNQPNQKERPNFTNTDLDEIRALMNPTKPTDKFRWEDANLQVDFGKGVMWTPMMAQYENLRVHFDPKRMISLAVTCYKLPTGDIIPLEEIRRVIKSEMIEKLTPLKADESDGQPMMDLWEGEFQTPISGKWFARVARIFRSGAVYLIVLSGQDADVIRAEFTRIMDTMQWIDEDLYMSIDPLAELKVQGAGMSLDCTGVGFITSKPSLPYATAAYKLTSRFEMTAFDLRGMEMTLPEASKSLLDIMAIGVHGKYSSEESEWGGQPALIFTPTSTLPGFGNSETWRMRTTQRNGFLYVSLETWVAGDDISRDLIEKIAERVRFSEPEGDIPEVTDDEKRTFASLFYNQVGLGHFGKGKYNGATKAFSHSFNLDNSSVASLANWVNSLSNQGRKNEALTVLEKHGEPFSDHQDIKLWKAQLLSQNNRKEESIAMYEELIESGFRDQEQIFLLINDLQAAGNNDRAVEIARKLHDETGNLLWQRVLANSLWTAGKPGEARELYQELKAELKLEVGFMEDFASLLLELEDFPAALATVADAEKLGAPSPGLLYTKGLALLSTGKPKGAAQVFEELDKLVPGNQSVREALAQALAMQGRGSMEGVRPELEAIPIPRPIVKNAKDALTDTDVEKLYPGEAWIYREYLQLWDWKEGQDARTTCRQVIEIVDTPAIRAFSSLTVSFKGYSERINVNILNVRGPDGEIIGSFSKEEIYVQDEAGALANGNKILTVPVPSLSKGSVIEFVYTKSLIGTAEEFPMVLAGIPESSPLVYGAIAFQGDLGKILFKSTEGFEATGSPKLKLYEERGIQRRIGTAYTPRYDRWSKLCWAADNSATWKDEANKYLEEIEACLAETQFAAEVVRDLELKGKNHEDIVRTVVRWMNRNFRYEGLEFGRRARIPASGGKTLSRGFGDCKDFSVMIRAILREAGVKADLALVNSASVLREDLPSLDQFDHMVVFLPEMGDRILDGTLTYFNTPDALGEYAIGEKAFLLEDSPPRFADMSESDSALRSVSVKRTVDIDAESGDAIVTETCEISPAHASMLRYGFSSVAEAERVRLIERAFRGLIPQLNLSSMELENLDDPFAPLVMKLKYRIPSSFQLNDGILSGSIPNLMERWLFQLSPERGRSIGLEIRVKEHLEFRTVLKIPDGHVWLPPEKKEHVISEPEKLDGRLSREKVGNEIHIDGSLTLNVCEGDEKDFGNMVSANERMFEALSHRLRFSGSEN